MKGMINAYGAAVIAATLATPAMAQVIGSYTGTTADGNGVTFVVGTDADTGDLAITSATIFFSAPCKNSSYVLNEGWGFGLNADITKGRVFFSTPNNYFTFLVSLAFSSDGQSAAGTVTSISPTLTPVGPKPTHSLICTSPKQAVTVSLQSADDAARQGLKFVPGKTPINLPSPRASAESAAEVSE